MSQIVLIDPTSSNQIVYEQRENAHSAINVKTVLYWLSLHVHHSIQWSSNIQLVEKQKLLSSLTVHWYIFENNNTLNVYKVPVLKSILAARCPTTVVYVDILWLQSNETMSKSVWISKAMFWGCMVRTGGQWHKPCVCWGSDPDNHFYINRPAGSLRFTGFCWFFCWFV